MIECENFKKCEFCNENIFRLCKCEEYQHINCIKYWIKQRKFEKENKKKTVHNYFINIFFCDERIEKDPYCNESICSCCDCKYCNTFYPLKFKYKEINNEKEKKEEIVDFYPIKEPEDSSYMILESLEYRDDYRNSAQYIKSIHVIKLINNNEITIGRDQKNDVILNHSSVCRQHAKIKYIDGKILLKNISLKSGTLALIQKDKFELSTKPVFLQVNRTFIEAQIMEKEEYESKLPKKEEKKETNENDNPSNQPGKKNEENSNKNENTNEYNDNYAIPNPSYGSVFYDNDVIKQY